MSLNEQKAYLKYFAGLARQPWDEWQGFYLTPADGMNFGLRFQLAFPVYALYGIARAEPDLAGECAEVIDRFIQKMLHPKVWAYWFYGALASENKQAQAEIKTNFVQGAVEFTHSKLGLAHGLVSPDPCRQGNIQYSGHLASMLGFYQLLTGDNKYNREGFALSTENEGARYAYEYNYSGLVENIARQMQENHFGGVCCEPGRAYAACNNHGCIANILHDRIYGTTCAMANSRWASWVEDKMLTSAGPVPLPAPNGLLSVAYMPEVKLPLPVSFNLTDAWGLAFMAAWHPTTARSVYPRFRRRLKKSGAGLKLGSLDINERMEISTTALNSAFALVLAREMGDDEVANGLENYLVNEFKLENTPAGGRFLAGAKPAPYVTALLALAGSLTTEGSLYRLING